MWFTIPVMSAARGTVVKDEFAKSDIPIFERPCVSARSFKLCLMDQLVVTLSHGHSQGMLT